MPRSSSRFVCSSCGFQSPRWYGRCPECGEWNTLVEEVETPRNTVVTSGFSKPESISDLSSGEVPRFSSGMKEFDRVLGGGFVPGSILLLGGEPGIGKSTLLLSVSEYVSLTAGKVLYVSGEESKSQVKMRADRLGVKSQNLFVMSEKDIDHISEIVHKLSPVLLVIDSIQTCQDSSIGSLPGGPTQVRACATKLQAAAKDQGITAVVVGHTLKSGGIAGPKLLEHLVDTVLYFEGDSNYMYRLVRAQKNRFGATNEIAVFQMTSMGLVEVSNPSEMFLSGRDPTKPGSCVAVSLKGNRPVCVEVQALVAGTTYGTPRRVTSGLDYQRVSLIMAVLSKRLSLALDNRDAYVKTSGGIEIDEPGADLACALALLSSYYDVPVKQDLAVFGEVGLSGEIRSVPRVEERVKEAARIGFRELLVPKQVSATVEKLWSTCKITGVSSLEDVVKLSLAGR